MALEGAPGAALGRRPTMNPRPVTRFERVEAAWRHQEADRVPVAPLNCYINAYRGGISIREMLYEPDKLTEATVRARSVIGEGDQEDPNITTLDHLSFLGKSGWDQATLDWRLWDQFPPQGNIPSFFEKCILEDYQDVMARGFSTILFNRQLNPDVYRRSPDQFLYHEFEYPEVYATAWRRFVEQQGVPIMMGGRATIPFELVMYYRGFAQIVRDIYRRPEELKAMCDWVLEHEIVNALRQATVMGAGYVPGAEKVFFQAGVVGPPYVSPAVFEEFVWPTLKRGVDMIVGRGYKAHVHMDGDLTSVLPILRELATGLPEGTVLLDFEKTDMKAAKDVLGDRICLHGNVPAALLCFGAAEEVTASCKRLIDDCAAGGGFILSTECETPWNARPENVRAMIQAAETYGRNNGGGYVSEGVETILAETRAGLKPPTQEECDRVMAKWLFGERAEKIMRYAPWSFALMKLMWKEGEEPWKS
jgi:uroporphyrinogen-III decarboxylase